MRTFLPDLALLDMKLPDGAGTALLPELAVELEVPVIVMAAHDTVRSALAALRAGARDLVEKPVVWERLEAAVVAALEVTALRREVRALRAQPCGEGPIIGDSPAMQELLRLVARVAPSGNAAVLIEGEPGTGKGAVARLVHRLSPRAVQPFVTVRCSGVAGPASEVELFGAGADAVTDGCTLKRGAVELADRGTLFLDGIGWLSPGLQAKLLRFLEDRTFRRVGGARDLAADTRLVMATDRNLAADVAAGLFRADLFHRLRGNPLRLPPLRERASDVPELAHRFVASYAHELGKRVHRIAPAAMQLLCDHDWPGNVRELRNVIERSVLLADGDTITAAALPPELRARHNGHAGTVDIGPAGLDIEELERTLLREALRRAEGNRTVAGRLLGLSRHQIRNRVKKYGEPA
jgi:DNA-binding NtrC family response regulator